MYEPVGPVFKRVCQCIAPLVRGLCLIGYANRRGGVVAWWLGGWQGMGGGWLASRAGRGRWVVGRNDNENAFSLRKSARRDAKRLPSHFLILNKSPLANSQPKSASWRANQIPASIYFHLATRQNSTNRKIVYSKACKTFHNMSFC